MEAQRAKNLPAMQEARLQSQGQEDPQEKEVATHRSILPGEFQGQEGSGRLHSTGLQRDGHDGIHIHIDLYIF